MTSRGAFGLNQYHSQQAFERDLPGATTRRPRRAVCARWGGAERPVMIQEGHSTKRSERGFTVVEMLIATTIMMTVTGAIFSILDPAQGMFKAQPEVSDMQQRMRVGVDTLSKDLIMAGAGSYAGSSAGALYNFFAPVLPYRSGDTTPDAPGSFFDNKVSILYVPPTPSQTSIRDNMPNTASQLKVNAQANCPPDQQNALCGFKEGMRVVIFDQSGAFDPITITSVQDAALHIGYDGELSVAYSAGSKITQIATHTYYLKEDAGTNTYQLMHYDGYQTDLPVVDNVVKLKFEYFGDPAPPQLLPNVCLTADCKGPWTTYGPKPPALGVNNASDTWGAGENCTFQVVNGQHAPRLATLAAGVGQVKLNSTIFTDNTPMCPDGTKSERFDADLLRIRRVRISLRVQAALASLRGPAGLLFIRGGSSTTAERYVPDQELQFDVTPRNMNLGR